MAYLKQAIKINPTNSTGFAYIGRCYQEQKQYRKALDYYLKSLEIEKSGWTYSNISDTYYYMGNYQKQKECIINGALLGDEDCQKWCRDNEIEWEID
jgi:tetratricopeptide (TPR) repeat protein